MFTNIQPKQSHAVNSLECFEILKYQKKTETNVIKIWQKVARNKPNGFTELSTISRKKYGTL